MPGEQRCVLALQPLAHIDVIDVGQRPGEDDPRWRKQMALAPPRAGLRRWIGLARGPRALEAPSGRGLMVASALGAVLVDEPERHSSCARSRPPGGG